jgi:Leucine Rich repeat
MLSLPTPSQPASNLPDFSTLAKRWHEAAESNNMKGRDKLIADTGDAINSMDKAGAENLARGILERFDDYGLKASTTLAKYIAEPPKGLGRAAYPVIHRLFRKAAHLACVDPSFKEQSFGRLEYIDETAFDAVTEKCSKERALGYLPGLGIDTTSEAIEYVKKLKEQGIDLKYIQILDIKFTLEEFDEFIACMPNLENFVAENGDFRGKLSQKLATLNKLTSLFFCNCHFGDEGVQAITGLSKLRSLFLIKCEISNKGAFAISNMSDLEVINIGGNNIRVEGIKALITKLTKLKFITIGDHHLSFSEIKELHEVGKQRPDLQLPF